MLEYPVLTADGAKQGVVCLESSIFAIPFRLDIISRVIRWQHAKRQSGTHATKMIGAVTGTGKKPYKQKGTGRARHGSLRSPQFRGGAVIFGPQCRSHAHDLPKKIRKLGLKVALSYKVSESSLYIWDSFNLPSVSSKIMLETLKTHQLENVLFLGSRLESSNLIKSVKNLKNVDFLPIEGLNVLDLMAKEKLVISQSSLDLLKERLS